MPSVEVYDSLVKKGVTLGKYGYEKVNGVCKEKQKVTCSENEELGADGITCIKKNTEDNNKDEELNNSEE